MADNVGYTPGSGATVAADEIGGVLHQRVKIGVGADGTAVDVSSSNPLPVDVNGEMIEAIEALRMAINSLTRTVGLVMPDTLGRMRVLAENPTAANLTMTASLAAGQTLATLTTLSTLTNQTQVGGFNAADQIPALMNANAGSLRRNISTS
jgi:hypothetical protein